MVSLQFRGSKFLIKPALLAIDKALSAFKENDLFKFSHANQWQLRRLITSEGVEPASSMVASYSTKGLALAATLREIIRGQNSKMSSVY